MSLSPRELSILLEAQQERHYDEMERMAIQAMMNRHAYHAKRLKQTQLFKRPTEFKESIRTIEDLEREEKETMEWLSQFEEFKGKIK